MRNRYFYLLIVLCFFFALSNANAGCLAINEEELKNLPVSHQIKGVKPIIQGPYQCAPTSMAMVMNFWGVEKTKDELWEKIKSPDGKSSQNVAMMNYFNLYGFEAMLLLKISYTELQYFLYMQYFLYKGYPLIAFVKSRKNPSENHCIVLTGYNEKSFKIMDPDGGVSVSLTYKRFKKLHPTVILVVCPKKSSALKLKD